MQLQCRKIYTNGQAIVVSFKQERNVTVNAVHNFKRKKWNESTISKIRFINLNVTRLEENEIRIQSIFFTIFRRFYNQIKARVVDKSNNRNLAL